MKNQNTLYTQLSNKYHLPRQVIEVICNSPFKFASQSITNLDYKPIMFAYLGKFKLKNRYVQKDANR